VKRDFLAVTDLTTEEIYQVFEVTRDLKEKTRRRIPHPYLAGYISHQRHCAGYFPLQ